MVYQQPMSESRGFLEKMSPVLMVLVVVMAARWYSGGEIAQWMRETWSLVRKIVPILLIGVFVAGMVKVLLPEAVVQRWVGGNSFENNLLASVFGALMYFPIMTEVAFVKMLLKVMGAGIGPGMAILLTGPGVSLPGMVILAREIGPKRTFCYVSLVVLLAALAGCFFGSTWGSYLCSCEFK